MKQDTHPYQVSIWVAGNGNPKSILEKGHWMEQARCITKDRAEEVALCLSLRHSSGVQVAELVQEPRGGARFVGYKYLPESARDLAMREEAGRVDYVDKARRQVNGHDLPTWAK